MKEQKSRRNIIVGKGMLAKHFSILPDSNALVFASGVSNSGETRQSEFHREIDYLVRCSRNFPDKKLIYFSSYLAENGGSAYSKHKITVENTIREISEDFVIFRLPQVVGITQNRTLFNFLIKSIFGRQQIVVYKNAYRSLLDVDDLVRIASLILDSDLKNEMISIGPPSPKSIIEIVRRIEQVVGIKANARYVDAGDYQSANVQPLLHFIGNADPVFRSGYQDEVIVKYATKFMSEELS